MDSIHKLANRDCTPEYSIFIILGSEIFGLLHESGAILGAR